MRFVLGMKIKMVGSEDNEDDKKQKKRDLAVNVYIDGEALIRIFVMEILFFN